MSGAAAEHAVAPSGRQFSYADRLHQGADFQRRIRSGARHADRYFSLHYELTDRGRARLGLAVGRRVSTKATERNRIKRVLREAFRHAIAELPSIDLVVLVRPPSATLSNEELRKRFGTALRQVARRVH